MKSNIMVTVEWHLIKYNTKIVSGWIDVYIECLLENKKT